MTFERIGHFRAGFGESPTWSPIDGALWWVDLHGRSVLRTFEGGQTEIFKTPGFPANNPRAVLAAASGAVIVALDDKLARLDPQSGTFTDLPFSLPVPDGHVLNDATVDPQGRLIIGTMLAAGGTDGKGVLLSVENNAPPRCLAEGFFILNGLAFSPDGKTLYVSDSIAHVKTVWRADYDAAAGTMGRREVFVSAEAFSGRPDGAAVDIAGGYWIAALEAGCLHRFFPDGTHDLSVTTPAPMPSKPCFGGKDLHSLYVTTAGTLRGVDDGKSGALFAGISPYAGHPMALCLL